MFICLHFHKLQINHLTLQSNIVINIFLKNVLHIYSLTNNFLNFINEVPINL